MNSLLDESLVGLALLVSGGYALISLGPKSLRRSLLAVTSRVMMRLPPGFALKRIAERLAAAATAKAAGACGGCDSCGTEQAGAGSPEGKSQPVEIAVPVSKIGRRA
jgi:hypothetical protein